MGVFSNPEWEEFESSRLGYRSQGYCLLSGKGLEVGAMDHPANLPCDCHVVYVDAATEEELSENFQELGDQKFVKPDHILDLDTRGITELGSGSFDFVVLNHVIEHVANPIQVIEDLVNLLKPDGMLSISAPDKRYTFDNKREITQFEHLKEEYRQEVDFVSDEHYMDYIRNVHPEILEYDEPKRSAEIQRVRDRREHAHVWTSETFREFLDHSFLLLGLEMKCHYECFGDETSIEYFGIWQFVRKEKKGWLRKLLGR